jgi:hypothetical protein
MRLLVLFIRSRATLAVRIPPHLVSQVLLLLQVPLEISEPLAHLQLLILAGSTPLVVILQRVPLSEVICGCLHLLGARMPGL